MGKLVHFEIPSTDLTRSKTFYKRLFGWQIEDSGKNYLMITLENNESGGIFEVDQIKPSQIAIYFEVADISEAIAKAIRLGGKEIEAKRSIGEHGFIGAFSDSCGVKIDIWSKI